MLSAATSVALGLLVLAALLCLRRLVVGATLVDRMVALQALLLVSASALAVLAVRSGSGASLGVLPVPVLVGFVATVTVTRFIDRRDAS